MSIEETVVNSSNTKHIALNSKSHFLSVSDVKNLRGNKTWSATADENIDLLIYFCC